MREPLNRLYRGELSFAAFVIQTRQHWVNLARRLIKKWDSPPAVSVDDLVQEMLFKCWDLLDTYDPDKSPIEKYIIYNSVNYAKRWLHKQRGARYYMDRASSRYPLLYDDLDNLSEAKRFPDQEKFIERLEKLNLATNIKELLILHRLINIPSIDLVTSNLYSDPKIRLALRFNSYDDARRIVHRSVLKISRNQK